MTKERLDKLLVNRALFTTRNKAYAAVVAGEVSVAGEVCRKPGLLVDSDSVLERKPAGADFVSRGGVKLAHALDTFNLDVNGKAVLDAGASTGGFTDCLLRRGAAKVIAVDVGYGQLAWRLRQDPRVEVLERTNIRYLTPDMISQPADLATLDLSFISLTKVTPAVRGCLQEDGQLLCLVKPQFEAGKGVVDRSGVIKDPNVHTEVLTNLSLLFRQEGLAVKGLSWSPIVGAKGNIEFWLWLSKTGSVGYSISEIKSLVAEVVAGAHETLRAAGTD